MSRRNSSSDVDIGANKHWIAFHIARAVLLLQSLLLLWIAFAVLRCHGLMICTYTELLPMLAHLPPDFAAAQDAVHRPFVRLIAIVVALAGIPSVLTHVLLGLFAPPPVAWRAVCSAALTMALALGAHVVLILLIGFGDPSATRTSSYVMQHAAPLLFWLLSLAVLGAVQFSRDPGTAPLAPKSYRDIAIRAVAVFCCIAFVIACAVAIGAPVLASDMAQRVLGDQSMSTADILRSKDVHPFATMSVAIVMELCGILSGMVCSLSFAVNAKTLLQRCLLLLPSTVYWIGASLALATFDGVVRGERSSISKSVLQAWLTGLFFFALLFIVLQASLAVATYRRATASANVAIELEPLGADSSASDSDSSALKLVGLIPSRQRIVGESSSDDSSDSPVLIPARRRLSKSLAHQTRSEEEASMDAI